VVAEVLVQVVAMVVEELGMLKVMKELEAACQLRQRGAPNQDPSRWVCMPRSAGVQ